MTMAPSYQAIVAACAEEASCRPADVTGPRMFGQLTRARHRAFYLARTLRGDLSLPQIGRMTGGRDHTTVMNGVRRVAELILQDDPCEKAAVARIKARLAECTQLSEFLAAELRGLDQAIAVTERRLEAARALRAELAGEA